MRIAIFTDTFLPQINGVTNTLQRFGRFLEQYNYEYIFITPDQKVEEEIPYNIESFLSAPLLVYPECRFTFVNKLRLNKKLNDFKPDIIFCMTEFTMGICGLNYGKKHKIPVITNYSTNFNTILKSYKLNVFEKLLTKYLSWFHKEASYTVTPSKQSEEVLHNMGVHNTGIFSRGIDYRRFSPENRDDDLRRELGLEGKLGLLYVGRLSLEKDLDVLRDAMELLNQKHKDRIKLIVTGEGPMKSELMKTMPDNVVFTGYKKGEELAKIYASCDIFTFPSSFETFGNVVLEAFASGTPVVGVNKGGVMSLIKHEENGYLVEPHDAKGFAVATEQLIENDILRYAYGTKGRAFARTKSWDQVFSNLIEEFAGTIIKESSCIDGADNESIIA